MSTAFAIFFTLYLLYALWDNALRRADDPAPRTLSSFSAALQAPLFLTTAWLAARAGVFDRELVFLPAILLALVVGHLLFALSLIATDRQPREALRMLGRVPAILAYLRDDPATLTRVFAVSFSEEVIYRAAAQPWLIERTGSPALGIGLAAAAFCVVHAHFFRNPWPQSAEFAAFALLLGALYFYTGSLIAVAVIHAVRNWEIAYLEHVLAQQEDAPAPAAGSQNPESTAKLSYEQ